jgi:hypothetical protein
MLRPGKFVCNLVDFLHALEELHCILFTFFGFSIAYPEYFKAIIKYETKDADSSIGIENVSKTECYGLGEQIL